MASCPTATYAAEVSDAGQVAWKSALPSSPTELGQQGPVVTDGIALFPGDSDLTALSAADGHRLWNIHIDHPHDPLPDFFWGLWQWSGAAYALINYSTATKDDLRLVKIDPATGKVRWKVDLDGSTDSLPVLGPDGVLALALGPTVEAVSFASGKVLWAHKFGQPDSYGRYETELTVAGGNVVAVSGAKNPSAVNGTAAAFAERTGAEQWTRAGIPNNPLVTADGGTVLLYNGTGDGGTSTTFPMTALAGATGKTLWQVPIKQGRYQTWVEGVWSTPGTVVFTDDNRIYGAGLTTGLRWSVPGRPDTALVTATDLIYYQWKEVGPVKPFVNTVYDRRLSTGAVRWTKAHAPYDILAPSGPSLLLIDSDPSSTSPHTTAYAVDKQTGKQVRPAVKLPAGAFAAPDVVGGDTIVQLNPWECASA